jgi:hypothetical protein
VEVFKPDKSAWTFERKVNILSFVKGLSEVAKDAMELIPGERRRLARILLELSEEDTDYSPDVETAWEDEICRRMDAVKSGTAAARSYEEVFADLDRRFPS